MFNFASTSYNFTDGSGKHHSATLHYLTDAIPDDCVKITAAPRSRTVSGYGKAIPTAKMIRLEGKWFRVYCTIYSNSGTCWIKSKGIKYIVDRVIP